MGKNARKRIKRLAELAERNPTKFEERMKERMISKLEQIHSLNGDFKMLSADDIIAQELDLLEQCGKTSQYAKAVYNELTNEAVKVAAVRHDKKTPVF